MRNRVTVKTTVGAPGPALRFLEVRHVCRNAWAPAYEVLEALSSEARIAFICEYARRRREVQS